MKDVKTEVEGRRTFAIISHPAGKTTLTIRSTRDVGDHRFVRIDNLYAIS